MYNLMPASTPIARFLLRLLGQDPNVLTDLKSKSKKEEIKKDKFDVTSNKKIVLDRILK